MTTGSKDEWRDYICRSPSGGKLLSSIGSSVALAKAPSINTTEVERLLKSLRRGRPDVRTLASTIDLLNPQYENYFSVQIIRLLDHLSSETIKEEAVVGPALSGNPRWDKTILARRTGALPPGRYISRLPRRSFSRPENLLLKWLIKDIQRELHSIERQVGVNGLPITLRRLYSSVDFASRAYGLSDIDPPSSLSSNMLLAARHSRRPEYREAAEMARRRDELNREVSRGKWKALLSLLADGWLEPIDNDDLFELYALTICLEAISDCLGFGAAVELGLVIRNRDYVARYESESGVQITVYFDQSPPASLGVRGKYRNVIDAHEGISGNARRPDVTVVCRLPSGVQRTLFVEVKRSQNREYLSDSIYKAFAYIHDYSGLWHGADHPKVILFVPEQVNLRSSRTSEVVFVSPPAIAGVANAMKSAFFST